MATVRQIKAAQYIAQGDSASKAMIKAGYTPASAKNPKNLTGSQSFLEIMEKHGITDDKITQVLNEGLAATKTIAMGKDEDAFVDVQPDYMVRHKYLETALRLKGHSKETPSSNTIVIPILGGSSVQTNNGNAQVIEAEQKN